MRYDHLISRQNRMFKCSSKKNTKHYWIPIGAVRATAGDNVAVNFYCKYCDLRITEFLNRTEYETHKKTIENAK